MLNRYARAFFARVMAPVARALIRAGVSPDTVTAIGTVGVVAAALWFFPRGDLFVGTLVIAAFACFDMIDGAMAREAGRHSAWGAFLDSTLDRIGDAAVFTGLILYFLGPGGDTLLAGVSLWCLVVGALVSYVKARAEGLGLQANVGIAERADRLFVVLFATGFSGLGVPYLLPGAVWVLAVASAVTVVQRMVVVHRQTSGARL
jgi:CDP-diacylglycerol--glycerol-3-phosphate 3-phosphatidyltransferase